MSDDSRPTENLNDRRKELVSVSVGELFGVFNHSFSIPTPERVVLLLGENGVGKTVLLKLINSVHKLQLNSVSRTRFKQLRFTYSDGSELQIDKESTGDLKANVTLACHDKPTQTWILTPPQQVRSERDHVLERYLPFLTQVGPRLFRHDVSLDVLSTEEVIERFGELLPDELIATAGIPNWLSEFVKEIEVRFIETQRLIATAGKPRRNAVHGSSIPAVQDVADDLATKIQRRLAQYATFSQELERTFPQRLLEQLHAQDTPAVDLQQTQSRIDSKRKALLPTGLIDQGIDSYINIQESFRNEATHLLGLYLSDAEQKLDFLQTFAVKIQILQRILNRKFLLKELQISPDDGLTVVSKFDDTGIPLTALSSGEQHELILLYDLLFRVERQTLVLIDEPEISLHLDWQEAFLKDMLEIGRVSDLTIVIATHSPSLIYDRWDLTKQLVPPAGLINKIDSHEHST